jgi:probable F420-dependent oxidoreductase
MSDTTAMISVPPGRRVYGMQLPIQAQSSYFVAEWEKSAGPAELSRLARACDDNGYSYVGVCDHVALPESVVGGMGTHWADPIATLGWLAGLTTRVGLLTHVYVLPYRHPLVAAKQFATLDHLSGGRALVGVGAGHVEAEFAHLGVDFHGRGKAMDRGIPELAAALENEFVDGFGARPRPAQRPRPPIWVAGSSPVAIKRAARLGDGWLPQGPSNQEMVDALVSERERAGRADEAMMIGHITPFIHVGEPTWEVGEATLTGSPASIADRILAGTARGVNQLQVRFKARSCDELCDQITAFARDVAPLVTTI